MEKASLFLVLIFALACPQVLNAADPKNSSSKESDLKEIREKDNKFRDNKKLIGQKVDRKTPQNIRRHSVCQKVTNTHKDYELFVPLSTAKEWQSFRTNPGGATLSRCGCPLPWGGYVDNGKSVGAYRSRTVNNGARCQRQTRTCRSEVLSGSYRYSTCTDLCAGKRSAPRRTYTRPGSYTYVVPRCITTLRVTVIGAGGGGSRSKGRCAFHHYSGSGGGGVVVDVNVHPGQRIRVRVGKGGEKGNGGRKCYVQGRNGGDSSFGGYAIGYGGDGGGNRHYKHRRLTRHSKGGSYRTSRARRISAGRGQSKGISKGCGGRAGIGGGRGSCRASQRAGIGGGGYGSGRQYQNASASDGGHGYVSIVPR